MKELSKEKSGSFIVHKTESDDCFIPEEFNEEQLMIADTCKSFIEAEVAPNFENVDKGDRVLMRDILKKSGELGLMGISIPEAYGGFGQDFVTQMLAAEVIGGAYSFSVAFMAHTGIGTLPIMYYGNEEQRQKYVTKLASGEMIGAYCLTEPGAGSDANSGKTTAVLSEDGKHYILNGQKMWITNGGFCDTQVVFAKIDKDRILSAFIVETNWEGVEIGADEHKLGIKGSSTTQIYYNDVKVPVENLIGKRGEGFRIALSILHMGRMKLGANVIGAAKDAITQSVVYANERKQFGALISTFGAIKYKIAEMAVRLFAHESAIYRVSKDIDILMASYKETYEDEGRAAIDAISHFAVEDAILKVYGSEMLDYVVDEGLQIHGGMGYSAEMSIERGYRDSRINRIFEGTNEINRLLIVEGLIKYAKKGNYDMFGEAEKIFENRKNITSADYQGDYFSQTFERLSDIKKAILLVYKGLTNSIKVIAKEQEIQNNIADMVTELYITESLALRIKKLETMRGSEAIALYKDILDVKLFEATQIVSKAGIEAVISYAEGDEAAVMTKAIKALTEAPLVNVKEARRRIVDVLIDENKYKL